MKKKKDLYISAFQLKLLSLQLSVIKMSVPLGISFNALTKDNNVQTKLRINMSVRALIYRLKVKLNPKN